MDKQTTLTDNGNGTATDAATGLMWMIPFAGQKWIDNSLMGAAVNLSWTEATQRFGTGRKIRVPLGKDPAHVLRIHDKEAPALSRESYDEYQFGSKRIPFAGFHDWRLPTVEECFTLVKIAKEDRIFRTYSVQLDLLTVDLWTANSSNLSSESNVIVVRDWLKFPPLCLAATGAGHAW